MILTKNDLSNANCPIQAPKGVNRFPLSQLISPDNVDEILALLERIDGNNSLWWRFGVECGNRAERYIDPRVAGYDTLHTISSVLAKAGRLLNDECMHIGEFKKLQKMMSVSAEIATNRITRDIASLLKVGSGDNERLRAFNMSVVADAIDCCENALNGRYRLAAEYHAKCAAKWRSYETAGSTDKQTTTVRRWQAEQLRAISDVGVWVRI